MTYDGIPHFTIDQAALDDPLPHWQQQNPPQPIPGTGTPPCEQPYAPDDSCRFSEVCSSTGSTCIAFRYWAAGKVSKVDLAQRTPDTPSKPKPRTPPAPPPPPAPPRQDRWLNEFLHRADMEAGLFNPQTASAGGNTLFSATKKRPRFPNAKRAYRG